MRAFIRSRNCYDHRWFKLILDHNADQLNLIYFYHHFYIIFLANPWVSQCNQLIPVISIESISVVKKYLIRQQITPGIYAFKVMNIDLYFCATISTMEDAPWKIKLKTIHQHSSNVELTKLKFSVQLP